MEIENEKWEKKKEEAGDNSVLGVKMREEIGSDDWNFEIEQILNLDAICRIFVTLGVEEDCLIWDCF